MRALPALLLAAAAALVATTPRTAAQDIQLNITIGGTAWGVVTRACYMADASRSDPTGENSCLANFTASPLYNNMALAFAAAAAVNDTLGYVNLATPCRGQCPDDAGPLFPYLSDDQRGRVISAALLAPGVVDPNAVVGNVTNQDQVVNTYAFLVPLTSPQPPVCDNRTASITTLDAKPNGALCILKRAAFKLARGGSGAPVGVLATIDPFSDPDNNPAVINVTGVAANRMQIASCACPPAQSRAGKCGCAPDALLQGGSARLLPLPRARDSARREAATTVRLTFTATSDATGLSCTGHVDICSVRSSAPKGKGPRCVPFDATGALRDLTVCS